MKNFIFALLATLASFSAASAQTVTIDTVFFEDFEGTNGQVPTTISIYDNDSCFMPVNDFFQVFERDFVTLDSGLYVRSTFNTNPPCRANDWAVINIPINITPHTWLRWMRQSSANNSYGVYLSDTILPSNGNNFLMTPIFIDSLTPYTGVGSYDSLDLSAYAGQIKYVGFRYFALQRSYIILDEFYVFNRTIVGIDKSIDLPIQIYPNPSNSIFNITTEKMVDYVKVVDVLGNIVFEIQPQQNNITVDLSLYPSAIYFVQIQYQKQRQVVRIQKQ